ncbi:hypothetical protein PJL18_03150 [Paenarthrobacter nicotinovorans]|nr:hypothetical protein [Paenarthrobacter nicotinovorans]
MDNVRSGVGLLCGVAAFTVDGGPHQCVGGNLALADDGLVDAQALDGTLDVKDLHHEAVTGDEAGVC